MTPELDGNLILTYHVYSLDDRFHEYFEDRNKIDNFERIFKRKSNSPIRKGYLKKNKNSAVDYYTINNISSFLNEIV